MSKPPQRIVGYNFRSRGAMLRLSLSRDSASRRMRIASGTTGDATVLSRVGECAG